LNFLNIAESSLAGVGYCVHVAGRLGYIAADTVADLEREIRMASAPLVGLIRSTRLFLSAEVGAVCGLVISLAWLAL
jgi:four helix bundle protein